MAIAALHDNTIYGATQFISQKSESEKMSCSKLVQMIYTQKRQKKSYIYYVDVFFHIIEFHNRTTHPFTNYFWHKLE